MEKEVIVVGAGLAGSEAAYQLAKRGIKVKLYEMKAKKKTPAHSKDYYSELVCSNSLGSDSLENASGLMKEELRILGSLLIEVADKNRVPAGQALAVDRDGFSEEVSFDGGFLSLFSRFSFPSSNHIFERVIEIL